MNFADLISTLSDYRVLLGLFVAYLIVRLLGATATLLRSILGALVVISLILFLIGLL